MDANQGLVSGAMQAGTSKNPKASMIEVDAAALLLRGWVDPPRVIRIVFRGRDIDLSVPVCRVFGATTDSVAFKGEGGVVFEFVLRGCTADFSDAPRDDKEIESVIVFLRSDFKLTVMLLVPQITG